MCHRITVVVLCVCVCVSVCYHEISYLPRFYVAKFYSVVYGVVNVFTVWLSLKTLHSRVLAPFASHRRLPRSPRSLASFRRTNKTVMASFQL